MSYTICTRQQAEAMRALVSWWRGNRPIAWNIRDHLDNPEVNANGRRERRLARAAASLVSLKEVP